ARNIFAELPRCAAVVAEHGEVVPLKVRSFVERNDEPPAMRPARELNADARSARNGCGIGRALGCARHVERLGPCRTVIVGPDEEIAINVRAVVTSRDICRALSEVAGD